jgi:methylase of polypeptide subunit release factors
MSDNGREWNPLRPRAWANALGLVDVPMFGARENLPPGDHAVLLDGDSSSFAMSVTDDSGFAFANDPVSWAWSANLTHSLIINQTNDEMFLRRWDGPSGSVRRFRLARNPQAAGELLKIVQKSLPPRLEDVVLFVLRAFRTIRNSLPSDDGLDAIRVLNILLLGAESVLERQITTREWVESRTLGEAVEKLTEANRELADARDLPRSLRRLVLGEALLDHFLSPEPQSQCRLSPEILLRHASGQLYQEAHLRLERESRQMHLPGLAPDTLSSGLLTKDVRFTPPSLARALAQQALDALPGLASGNRPIEILDPACGSGVFLQEALRELTQRGYRGGLTLRGFDRSPISCAIARFCLGRAKLDAPEIRLAIDIREQNSLRNNWGRPDVILMNPPFVPWDRMVAPEQESVRQILGELATYRMDMAMAFIWHASRALKENGVIGSVLPAPLFETRSGQEWREALAADYALLLLGRFEGYGFFRGSLVEPGILLMSRKRPGAPEGVGRVQIVIAKSGHEDEAVRGLRRKTEQGESSGDWDAFFIQRSAIGSASWMPRFRQAMRLAEVLSDIGMATVGDLFSVHQGIRTGFKQAFVLSLDKLESLPKKERRYFRPVASNSTIHDGRISRDEFVFYPYGQEGLLLSSETEVRAILPKYFADYLEPQKEKLRGRSSLRDRQWWELSEPRLSWQGVGQSKIVSTYFGDRGSFAFDTDGSAAVLQGFGWLWRKAGDDEGAAEAHESEEAIGFSETLLPWAYLCLLNSGVFENLLESSCPRVQGGQFDLSPRFVNRIFLPNLSNDLVVTGDLVRELAQLGRRIHAGDMPDFSEINKPTARAYGLPE